MNNKLYGALSALVFLLAMVGTASAVTYEVNLTGASAQYKFWNGAAPAWLAAPTADHGGGCATVDGSAQSSNGKNGISIGHDCALVGGAGNDIIFRYSAKASYDGILSMKNDNSQSAPAEICTTNDANPPIPSGQEGSYRWMADEAQTNFTTNVISGLKCVDISAGASDVAGETFVQSSFGSQFGHLGGPYTIRNFNGISHVNQYGHPLTTYRPVVVPFGFFVNDTALPSVTNVTRLMAANIYAGLAQKWSDFRDPSDNATPLPDKTVVACLRHAGSGTAASLDADVMHNDLSLAQFEQGFGAPIIYFNDGSHDEIACVNDNGGLSTTDYAAIGYADADTCVGATGPGGSCEFTRLIDYQGEAPNLDSVRFGRYGFWSPQWMFEDPDEPNYANTHPLVQSLYDFASVENNLQTYLPSKAAYWVAQGAMCVAKGSDFAYPQQVRTDTDGDTIRDCIEETSCEDGTLADTDGDGFNDNLEDLDLDGTLDAGETDPCDPLSHP